jgi:hypothetical protein
MAATEFYYVTKRLFPDMAVADQLVLAEQLSSSLRIVSPPAIFL